jgi:HD superfamily phosphodiesterase
VDRIAREQTARGVAAELPQFKGAAAAEIRRDIEPASEQDIAAQTAADQTAKREGLTGGNINRHAPRHRSAIERCAEVRAGQADAAGGVEGQRGAGDRDFEARGAFRIA